MSGTRFLLISTLLITLFPAALADDSTQVAAAADDQTASAVPAEQETGQASSDEEPKYRLRYQVKPGQVIRYQSERVGELRTSVGPNTTSNVERVIQVRRFEVKDVDDFDRASLVMQYERVEMSVQANDGPPITYRSSMKPSQVPRYFARVADRLKGSAPRFIVTPVGAPLDGNDEIIMPREGQAVETRLMMPLPEHPVRVGDSWRYFGNVKVRVSAEIKRNVRLLTTCRLESVDDGVAKISFATSAVAHLKSNTVRSQLVSALPKGYCLLDINTGQVTKRVVRNNNSVHGFKGRQSLLTYSAEAIETLLPEEANVSQR